MKPLRTKLLKALLPSMVVAIAGVARTQEGFFDQVTKLPGEVNSPFLEFQPNISADGQTLVFGSKRPGGPGR